MAGILDLLNGADNSGSGGWIGGTLGGDGQTMTPEEIQNRLNQANDQVQNPVGYATKMGLDLNKVPLGGMGLAAGLANILTGNMARNRLGANQVQAQQQQGQAALGQATPALQALSGAAGTQQSGSAEDMADKFIQSHEGFSPKAYGDYAQTSIGYGTKGQPGQTMTQPQAVAAEQAERSQVEAALSKIPAFKSLPPQAQAGLISAGYNLGAGVFEPNKTLGADLASGNTQKLAQDLLGFNHAGGQVNPGLTKRRQEEAMMILGGGQQPQGGSSLTTTPMPTDAQRGMIHQAPMGVNAPAISAMFNNPSVPLAAKQAFAQQAQTATAPTSTDTPQGIITGNNMGQAAITPKAQIGNKPVFEQVPGAQGGISEPAIGTPNANGIPKSPMEAIGPNSPFGKFTAAGAATEGAAGVAGQEAAIPGQAVTQNAKIAQDYVTKGKEAVDAIPDINSVSDWNRLFPNERGQLLNSNQNAMKTIQYIAHVAGTELPDDPNMTIGSGLQFVQGGLTKKMIADSANKLGGVAGMQGAGLDVTGNTRSAAASAIDYLKQNYNADREIGKRAESALNSSGEEGANALKGLTDQAESVRSGVKYRIPDETGKMVDAKEYMQGKLAAAGEGKRFTSKSTGKSGIMRNGKMIWDSDER